MSRDEFQHVKDKKETHEIFCNFSLAFMICVFPGLRLVVFPIPLLKSSSCHEFHFRQAFVHVSNAGLEQVCSKNQE